MISLPAAPVHDGRVWYVPVDFVGRALAPVYGTRLELRKPSRLILLGDIRMPRVAARVEPIGSLTRVTFDVAPPTPHTVAQEGSRSVAPLRCGRARRGVARRSGDRHAAGGPPGRNAAGDRARSRPALRVVSRRGSARRRRRRAHRGRSRDRRPRPPSPSRAADARTRRPPAPPGQLPTLPSEPPPLLDLPSPGGLRAIVIDPGHGGDETGAKGSQGIAREERHALASRDGSRRRSRRGSASACC